MDMEVDIENNVELSVIHLRNSQTNTSSAEALVFSMNVNFDEHILDSYNEDNVYRRQ